MTLQLQGTELTAIPPCPIKQFMHFSGSQPFETREPLKNCLGRGLPLKTVPWKIAKIGLFVCLYPKKIKK